eukprot:CAMPEP_0181493114 /NCGR_PEP_ID=MMETSP1110-20121109/51047_1 /TAXON_ID=174948 /ORGANISM="Symbiodinium sp., Strain CCMP421" /LENGTH=87 /DNA_ID=CAMNT_0023620401 /DNA_START=323 /DNA_END=583 /DNA_ORIENTATION=-
MAYHSKQSSIVFSAACTEAQEITQEERKRKKAKATILRRIHPAAATGSAMSPQACRVKANHSSTRNASALTMRIAWWAVARTQRTPK